MKRAIAWFMPLLLLIGVFAAAPAEAQLDWSNAYVEGPGNYVIIRDVRFLMESYSVCWEWDTSANLLYRGVITGTVGDPCMGAPGQTSTVTVCATNSTNGFPMVGATVLLGGASGVTSGSGCVQFNNVPYGSYSLSVSAAGCSTASQTVNINQPNQIINVSLSCGLVTGNYRIVLNWGEVPTDLDSHLLVPGGYHIAWYDPGAGGFYPFAELDIDDVTSYGPETITIYLPGTGTYRYYVHNYSQNNYPSESGYPLTVSQATVTLYRGAVQLQSWNVPAGGSGFWWHVFDLDAVNQIITPVNVIQNFEPAFP